MFSQDKQNRPKDISLPRDGWEKMFEVIAALALIGMAITLTISWGKLPESIPVHFNWAGEPDSWGGRHTLLLMPIVYAFLYTIFTLLSFFPHSYNYPVSITAENAARQYHLARGLLTVLKAVIGLFFYYLVDCTIAIALAGQGKLDGLYLWLFIVLVFSIVGGYFYLSLRNR